MDDSVRRKEEEELQRVLELSMHDKGGRDRWYSGGYAGNAGAGSSRNASSSNLPAGGSSSAAAAAPSTSKPAPSKPAPSASTAVPSYSAPAPGYSAAPAQKEPQPASPAIASASTAAPASPKAGAEGIVTRVRALHTFEPTELGELAFEKGDIIKVVDRQFKDWWRGQLKGKTGIFPVNYVVRR